VAGVLAGRLTTGIKAAHTGSGLVGGAPGGSGAQHRQAVGSANYAVDTSEAYTGYGDTGVAGFTGTTPGTGNPLPPPPYGTVPPEGSVVPPTTPAGWDDPARRPGGVG